MIKRLLYSVLSLGAICGNFAQIQASTSLISTSSTLSTSITTYDKSIYTNLLKLVKIADVTPIVQQDPLIRANDLNLIGTNGNISSYSPALPSSSFTGTQPLINGIDNAGSIVNICSGASITLSISTSAISYQWYKCIATTTSESVIGFPKYTWGSWIPVSGATSSTLTVYSSDLSSTNIHTAYACMMTKSALLKGIPIFYNSYSGIVGIARAEDPAIGSLVISPKNVCPSENILVQLGFRIVGDNVTMNWTRQNTVTNSTVTYNSSRVDSLSIPSQTYLNGGYKYYLNISHSCSSNSKLLNDWTPSVTQALVEAYAPLLPTEATKTTCVAKPVTFTATVNNKNEFYSANYVAFWEYKPANAATWTKISVDNAIFSGSSTNSLQVTPPDTTYQNMQFRCTTNGACATLVSGIFTLKVQSVPQITTLTSSQNPACQSTSVTFTPTIKPSAFVNSVEYRWWVNDNVVSAFSASATDYSHPFSNSAVSVKCEVRANNACADFSSSKTLSVPVYSNPDVAINVSKTGCGGSTATLVPNFTTTSKAPYTYSWALPGGGTSTAAYLKGQSAGNRYYLTVTDACSKRDTTSVYVSTFPALTLICSKTDVLCNNQSNGKITATIAGGVTPYDIKITKQGSTTPVLNLTDTTYSEFSALNLPAGEYTVLVTDFCSTTQTATVSVNQPASLSASVIRTKQVTCNAGGDGEAELSITGGTEPYSINWSNGVRSKTNLGLFAGTYLANITDNNGCFASTQIAISQPDKLTVSINKTNAHCSGSADAAIDLHITGGTAPINSFIIKPAGDSIKGTSFKKLKAGTYTVVVKDACGANYTETVNLTEPQALQISISGNNVSCSGLKDGIATISISGGVMPYYTQWNTGDSALSIINLDSAFYKVTVRDQCDTISDSVKITKPSILQVTTTATDISCYGLMNGRATVVAQGGTYPYTYSWNNGSTDATIENLSKGKYTVLVSDARGCSKFQSVTIAEPEKVQATVSSIQSADCFGKATGSITVTASKGVPEYSYKWTNTVSSSEKAEKLAQGTYSVTVTDFCKDSVVLSATVSQPDSLSIETTVINPRCNNEKTGSISLSTSGGVGVYHYSWSIQNMGDSRFAKQLGVGSYSCTVSDNCSQKTTQIVLSEPPAITVNEKKSDASCEKSSNGWIRLNVQGGTTPYTSQWSFGGIIADSIGGLFPGLYSYSLHDANGCTASGTIEIAKPTALEVTAVGGTTACKQTTGTALATATGGTAPYSFKWNNQTTDAKASGLASGLYTVTVTDSKGCTAQTSATIGVSIKQYPICMVTVDSSGKANKIIWEKDNDPTVDSIRIYCFYGTYRKIGQVSATAKYSVYNDYMAKPRQTSYQYAISTLDKCGNESPLSYSHSTMLLWTNYSTEPNKANIEWTPYIDESGAFVPEKYYIYKGNSYINMDLIDSVPGSSSIYIDQTNDGARYYRVTFKKTPCIVSELKSDSGPFSQSLSNMSEASLVGTDSVAIDQIAIYPNPASDVLYISTQSINSKDAHFKLIASDGKVVLSKPLSDDQEQQFDISQLANGLYEAIIESNNKIERSVIVKK